MACFVNRQTELVTTPFKMVITRDQSKNCGGFGTVTFDVSAWILKRDGEVMARRGLVDNKTTNYRQSPVRRKLCELSLATLWKNGGEN